MEHRQAQRELQFVIDVDDDVAALPAPALGAPLLRQELIEPDALSICAIPDKDPAP